MQTANYSDRNTYKLVPDCGASIPALQLEAPDCATLVPMGDGNTPH